MTDSTTQPPSDAPDVALLLLDPVGGVFRVVVNLSNALAAKGLQVEVVFTGTRARPEELAPEVEYTELGARGVRDLLLPLVSYLRHVRPRTMISSMEHPNIIAVAAREISRVPFRLVLVCHGPLTPRLEKLWSRRQRLVLPFLIGLTFPRADAIIGVSRGVARDLEQSIPALRGRVRHIYNPIVDDAFFDRSPQIVRMPFEGFVGPVLVAAGRFAPPKDFPLLLQAFALALRQRDLRLVLLGDGPPRCELEGLAEELGISDKVAFPGMVPDPRPYMRHGDLFVVSSIWEGFGNVLVEAMACGTPVIATDCPYGPREILDGGRYGRLVPVGDAHALAEGILAALEDPVDASALIERARRFTVDESASAYLEVLEL